MVFTSMPAYLDPEKWQQQPTYQSVSCTDPNSQLLPPPPPPPPLPPSLSYGRGGPGSIRPGSMVDQARIANMPMPEPALKCPRCESTNTKFCYFNNYSLTQPRHFCKTCRRYWTRGGALRNVPVGGGFRRNRRIKSSSKSPVTSDNQASGASGSATSSSLPPLRFTSPIRHHLTEIPGGEIGLSYSSFPTPFNPAPQFPFLSAFDPFSASGYGSLNRHKQSISELNHFNSVKIEDTGREFDVGKQLFGGSGIEQYWNVGSSAWTDFSGFSSSANATNHFL